MQVVVISVGRLRPPYADDVAHYEKLLRRYVRLTQIELRSKTTTSTMCSAISSGMRVAGR